MHSPTASTTPSSKRTQWSEHRVSPELKIMQLQLGHEHASTTSIYTLAAPDYRARELERVLSATLARSNARLGGPTPKES